MFLLLTCLHIGATASDDTTSRIVLRINELRALHGAGPVTWSPVLAEYAASWAGALAPDWLRHSIGNAYGENVATISSSAGIGSKVLAAIDLWYAECERYSYAVPTFSESTSNFTQLVWAATRMLGAAVSPNGIVVMEFAPMGNIVGRFAHNVRPPGSNETLLLLPAATLPSALCSCTC